jgi:hypothetical protein
MTECRVLVCAAVFICVAGEADAQQADDAFTATVYSGLEHSENAVKQRGGTSANIGRVGLNADLNGDRRRMDYSLTGNASWAAYFGDALPDALEGGLSGLLNLGAEDSLLRWTVQDSLRQSLVTPQGNATPENSEFVNSLSAGPILTFRLGELTALTLSALYSRLSYQDSPLDSDSVSGTAGLSRVLPRAGSLGLFVGVTGTSHVLDEPGYDLRRAYLHYEGEPLANSTLSLDVGYIESRHRGATSGGPLMVLSLQRQISSISSISFSATRTITNTAELRAIEASGPVEHEQPISAPGAVKSTGFDAGWTVSGRRNSLALNGGWRKEEYQSAPQFDRKTSNLSASVSRRLRSTLTGTLNVGYNNQQFADPALSEFDYESVILSLNQRIGRRISGGLSAAYAHRSDKETSSFEFSEWRYGLTVAYLLTNPTR